MSDPLHSLKKYRPKKFTIPQFSNSKTKDEIEEPSFFFDDNKLLNEVIDDMIEKNEVKKVLNGVSEKDEETLKYDNDSLLSSLLKRVKLLESRNAFQEKELKMKSKRIDLLEDKLKLMKSFQSQDVNSNSKQLELQKTINQLQTQILEMETFLQDYGLKWVGNAGSNNRQENRNAEDSYDVDTDYDKNDNTDEINAEKSGENDEKDAKLWLQSHSLSTDFAHPQFQMDFGQIIKSVKDLNLLVGADSVQPIRTGPNAMQLRIPEPVPLEIYRNGVLLFDGPFRPFFERQEVCHDTAQTGFHIISTSAQQIIRDLEDGFFPSEFEAKHPDGVPILLKDRHTEDYVGGGGCGGGVTEPVTFSKLGESETKHEENMKQRKGDINAAKGNLLGASKSKQHGGNTESFFAKLPANKIGKSGQIIDIRDSVRNLTSSTAQPTPSCLLEATSSLLSSSSTQSSVSSTIKQNTSPVFYQHSSVNISENNCQVAAIRIKSLPPKVSGSHPLNRATAAPLQPTMTRTNHHQRQNTNGSKTSLLPDICIQIAYSATVRELYSFVAQLRQQLMGHPTQISASAKRVLQTGDKPLRSKNEVVAKISTFGFQLFVSMPCKKVFSDFTAQIESTVLVPNATVFLECV